MKPSDYIYWRPPYVGDFIMTYNGNFGIITDKPYNTQYTVFLPQNEDYHFNTLSYNDSYDNTYIEFVVVDEKINSYLSQLTSLMRSRLYRLSCKKAQEILHSEYVVDSDFINYQVISEILDNMFTENYTRDVGTLILSNEIKRVIKRDKKTGDRFIELRNGEVWRVHRFRKKFSRALSLAKKQYKSNKHVSNHTSYYKLIKKIK